MFRRPPRRRLAAGGKLIAIVGGDGAGKSSAVQNACGWLSKIFVVHRVHLGKPPRSISSSLVRAARVARRLMLGSSTTHTPSEKGTTLEPPPRLLDLLWYSLLARDRYRAYARARRVATGGGIVVCDRYPLRQIKLMDGPKSGHLPSAACLTGLAGRLVQLERGYYDRIEAPDVLIVLRVDPDVAVQRRGDEEAVFVRARSAEIWDLDWEASGACVVDANRSKEQVLLDVKSALWRRI
ncbi:MAG: hypothetical protein H0U16_05605 [Actinobacteria bacterium]|nr:hypothetical protein [Actinomycetota bacterium]